MNARKLISQNQITAAAWHALVAALLALGLCAWPLVARAETPPALRTASIAAQTSAQQTSTQQTGDYTLASGDKVRITVFGEPDLTGEYELDGSGYVRLPLLGQIKAAGLSAHGLESVLTQTYANGYLKEPRIAVEITKYRPFYIIGEVNKPGEYPYVNGMTTLNAIALAGGFTPRARESTLYVRRKGALREQPMRADGVTKIEPGDVVRVSETGFWSVMDVLQPVTGLVGAARYGIP